MVPAEFVPCTVAMLSDTPSQSFDLIDELLT
jgi:hypothetical protein